MCSAKKQSVETHNFLNSRPRLKNVQIKSLRKVRKITSKVSFLIAFLAIVLLLQYLFLFCTSLIVLVLFFTFCICNEPLFYLVD